MSYQILASVFSSPSGIFNESGKSVGYYIVSIGAILACFAVVFFASGKGKPDENKSKQIAYAGICVALSTVLSLFKIYEMPQGGSITPASMLPIAIYSYMYGARKGVLVCFAYGMLQALLGGYIVHPIQFLLDYPIAFAMIGLTGLFKKMDIRYGFALGFIIGVVLRYMIHSFGGMVFFAEYAAGQSFWAIFTYSFGYNSFLFIDGGIALALGFALIFNKGFAHIMKSEMPATKSAAENSSNDNK